MEEKEKPQGLIDPTNQGPKNPAKYFAQWKSTEQTFVYYDKAQKKNILLKLPFTFIPLAKAVCIKGYYEPDKMSYVSNEVSNPKTDPFVIKAYNNITKKNHVAFTGLWENISKDVKAVDGAWTESIYGAAKDEKGKLQVINVQLNGSGITHWFDFLKDNKIWGSAITVKGFTNEKKGSNKYVAPTFSLMKIGEKSNLEAAELQKEVLAYLAEYYAKNSSAPTPVVASTDKPVTSDKAPFVKGTPKEAQHSIDTMAEEMADINFGDPDAPEEF